MMNHKKRQDYRIFIKKVIQRDLKNWQKMDLLQYLDMNNEIYLNNPQRQSGVVHIVKRKVMNLVNEWYDICCIHHLIDNSPSLKT